MESNRPRSRPAHTPGMTRCAYTPDGSRLVTVGSNNTIRLYRTGHEGEPTNIDDCQEQNVCVATGPTFFVVGAEDGTVSLYSLATFSFERYLLRCTLPVRDVALSADGKWCAVASDETTVKLVSTADAARVRTLADHGRPAKHVAFDPKGGLLTASCVDGVVYVHSLLAGEDNNNQPELIRKIDGIIGSLDGEAEASSQVEWHPDGRAFAMATPTRDIQVVSKNDWEKQRAFAGGHTADITALAWSPNGALLASAARDGKVLLWETKTQSVVARYEHASVTDLSWHPTRNLLSFATSEGEIYIYTDFVADQYAALLKLPRQPAPFIHDPLEGTSATRRPALHQQQQQQQQQQKRTQNGQVPLAQRPRRESLGSIDSFLDGHDDGDGYGDDGDGFVVDDDNVGYAHGGMAGRKRGAETDSVFGDRPSKRRLLEPAYHEPFQPGATPWRGNRKYLCLNLIGFVWTVDQDSHHTVTVEFYDHEFQRDFHFTDTFLYDKACLTTKGTLFACPPHDDGSRPSTLMYRPHETWTQRADWRIELPRGEAVTAMSLGDSFITVTTTADYVRVYTLFGVPHRVYRAKSTPVVSCVSWRDYVLTMGNGPVGPDGSARLLYSIENVKRDEICQNEDTVALPPGATIKGLFFSDSGDPCIYDSTGTLLTLLHWRRPSRATWVPLLDTKLLARLASGRKSESYYPVAVADNKFHCIILKGGDLYPYFPRPLLSEFDFSVPLTSVLPKSGGGGNNDDGDAEMRDADDDDDGDDTNKISNEQAEARRLEQQLVLGGLEAALVRDLVDATAAGQGRYELRARLARLELEHDKTLLQMLAGECRAGEERGMRALELVGLMCDRSGRMAEAAGKVAQRYGRAVLGDKIRELAERQVAGEEEEGGQGEDGAM